MRKIIMLALAGFLYKKFQARNVKPGDAQAPLQS